MELNLFGAQHLFLVGMPGAGKTTLGRALAQHLRLPFVDLDAFIAELAGQPVADILEEQGEYNFREMEHEALHHVLERPQRLVVATGGGTPCYFANMEAMNDHGRTVYLSVTVPELHRRLVHQAQHRPLLMNRVGHSLELYLEQLLHEREPYYARAHGVVQRDAATLQDVLACV
jgi:shikimate kinase